MVTRASDPLSFLQVMIPLLDEFSPDMRMSDPFSERERERLNFLVQSLCTRDMFSILTPRKTSVRRLPE